MRAEGVFAQVQDMSGFSSRVVTPEEHARIHRQYGSNATAEDVSDHPHSFLVSPVFDELGNPKAELKGLLQSVVDWDRYLINLLPEGVNGVVCILKNSCGQAFTYILNGNQVRHGRRCNTACLGIKSNEL